MSQDTHQNAEQDAQQDTYQGTSQDMGQEAGQETVAPVVALVRDLDVPDSRPVDAGPADEREGGAESTASTVSTASKMSRDTVDVAEEARRTWREASDRDQPLTGAELGRLYNRSERWGRDRINEARAANPPPTPRRTKKAATTRPRARPRRQSATQQPSPHPSQPSAAPSRPAVIQEPPPAGEHPQSEHGGHGAHFGDDDVAVQRNASAQDLPRNDATGRDEAPGPPAPPAAPAPAEPSSPQEDLVAPRDGSIPEQSTAAERAAKRAAERRRWWAPWRPAKRAQTGRDHTGAGEHAPAPAAAPTARVRQARSQSATGANPQVQASAWVWWCAHIAVAIVAAVALVTSYDHMRILALKSGEGWRSWLLPISVDGLMIAASVTILARRRAGQRGGLLAWSALIGGVAASVAANVAGAHPDLVARLVAACPPLAALASVELLMQHIRLRATPTQQATEEDQAHAR